MIIDKKGTILPCVFVFPLSFFFSKFFLGVFFEFGKGREREDPIRLLWRSGTCLICYAQ